MERLSDRAAQNASGQNTWDPIVESLSNAWSRSKPDGTVILGMADNELMREELAAHIGRNFHIDHAQHFTYGQGPQGSPRLLQAVAAYFNRQFHPRRLIEATEFVITPGVNGMIDNLTWCLCNEGDAILFPQPLFQGFMNDVLARARGKAVLVPFERKDGTLVLDDVFDADSNLRCLERAYRRTIAEGIKVRAVMITNPHNPLGKCYPVETLQAVASFCARHDLHYLSDEIYAMSVFHNPGYPNATNFHSVLSVDLQGIIKPELVHVLYGAAKDFGANGLRIGAFHTRDNALRKAMISISPFGWSAYIVQDMWARLLEDQSFCEEFQTLNRKRLAQNYSFATTFLTQHDVPYYQGGNAAFFIFVDLRNHLLGRSNAGNFKELYLSSAGIEVYKRRQDELSDIWNRRGVTVVSASSCQSEELGWFRIIFTVCEQALRTGLQRFIDGIQEFEELEERIVAVRDSNVLYIL